MKNCNLCPRRCGVNRETGEKGYCKSGFKISLGKVMLHKWEEPCISGENGSGAVFFSGCSLRCVFCQNYPISRCEVKKEISVERLAKIFLELQAKKAHNLNLVSASHFLPLVIKALKIAKDNGLFIPVIYNTGGYEEIDSLKKLKGLVDIYLPDFKYFDQEIAKRYSKAPDYFLKASLALKEMFSQAGEAKIKDGLLKKGVLIRHLVLPGQINDSKKIIDYLIKSYGNSCYISLMSQFTPIPSLLKYPEINRKLTLEEYEDVVDYAISKGVENGFLQDEDCASENYIPKFDLEGVLE